MEICYKCHQPITASSSVIMTKRGTKHRGFEVAYCSSLGCPQGESILDNLRIAISQGFIPEFCRSHYVYNH